MTMTEEEGVNFARGSPQSFHIVLERFKGVAGVNKQAVTILSLGNIYEKSKTVPGQERLFQLQDLPSQNKRR